MNLRQLNLKILIPLLAGLILLISFAQYSGKQGSEHTDPPDKNVQTVVTTSSQPKNQLRDDPMAVTDPAGEEPETTPEEEDLWTRQQWFGDFEQMVDRRMIRALVPPSRMFFFIDRGKKQGLSYEALMAFEREVNRNLKSRHLLIKVVMIPTARNRLISDLKNGYGDIAVGNLTITRSRARDVDFSDPFLTGVNEIVVTGQQPVRLNSLFDLAGKEVYVRRSSSYYDSLTDLNSTLKSMGKNTVRIIAADEYLEDDDLLEMINAGLLPMTVIDSHKARFWAKIFPKIVLHPQIRLRTDGRIGWAFRKGSPGLKRVINEFVRQNKKGTLHGNILYNRYLKNTRYVENNTSSEQRKKYEQTVEYFKKYGRQYDFPYLLLTALAYQESGLDQQKRSAAGAIGIMQVLPSTAADQNINIKGIHRLENNIHAGTKYLAFMKKRYFSDPSLDPLNSDLFTIAAYNAGPARIARLRREAAQRGLDPNVWFNNVEVVAAARIGRETVRYVGNIYKYYVAYKRIFRQEQRRKVGKTILEGYFSTTGAREGKHDAK